VVPCLPFWMSASPEGLPGEDDVDVSRTPPTFIHSFIPFKKPFKRFVACATFFKVENAYSLTDIGALASSLTKKKTKVSPPCPILPPLPILLIIGLWFVS